MICCFTVSSYIEANSLDLILIISQCWVYPSKSCEVAFGYTVKKLMKWKIPWLQVHVVLIFKVVFFSCANFLCPPTSIVVPRSQGLFRRWPKGSRPMGKRLTLAEYFTYIVSSNNYFPHCNVDNRINKSCGRKLCTGHPTRTKFSFFCHETCTSFVMIF